jgi:folate-binding protein YgfZ
MSLQIFHQQAGAELAPDGIPLNFGDVLGEYQIASTGALLFDRSHEGRLILTGEGRFDLLNRLSTNQLLNLKTGEGAPTIFINANGRIIDRVMVYAHTDDQLMVIAPPSRHDSVKQLIKRNIFYNDDVQIVDERDQTHQFALHGVQATALLAGLVAECAKLPDYGVSLGTIAGHEVIIGKFKPFVGDAWQIIVKQAGAISVWDALKSAGATPSGGIVYNALRIRSGQPAVGTELTADYIPLELGLWDEISFNKGCYTGQEIIARMESRNKLAKMLVRLRPAQNISNGTQLFQNKKRVGQVTSSVIAPDGELYVMGVVRTDVVQAGDSVQTEAGVTVELGEILGVQPSRG